VAVVVEVEEADTAVEEEDIAVVEDMAVVVAEDMVEGATTKAVMVVVANKGTRLIRQVVVVDMAADTKFDTLHHRLELPFLFSPVFMGRIGVLSLIAEKYTPRTLLYY